MRFSDKILTVDLEDWFHILDNPHTKYEHQWNNFPSRIINSTFRLLDLFDLYDCKCTFFVLGYVARKYPELVREISLRGHEIASHGDQHQLVYSQTPAQFERDLVISLEAITKACGAEVKAYRAPGFSIRTDCTWAFDVLVKCGIEIDCSIFSAARSHGGMRNQNITSPVNLLTEAGNFIREFPISTLSVGGKPVVFSGGGYFRITPQFVLKKLFKSDKYLMTYFHPRDFDPEQPMVPGLTVSRRFKSYVGLRTTFSKLESLLEQTSFMTLASADNRTDWSSLPIHQISKEKRFL